jgi:hypothetical protein
MDDRVNASFIPVFAHRLTSRPKDCARFATMGRSMMRAWGLLFGMCVMVWAACGGASSQPLTPDPDPTPTAQDIAALQNAQTSAAAGSSDGGAAAVPASNGADSSKNKSRKP